MIADRDINIDGKWYKKGETIHDLGDLDRVDDGSAGMKHDYVGVSATAANFPKYVASGSTITMLNASTGTTIYKYHAPSQQWIKM